jgi:hypothetical protein
VNGRRLSLLRRPLGCLLPLVVVLGGGLGGCTPAAERATAAPSSAPATDLPGSRAELEPLIVSSVPSGLPRLPDRRLSPPAGPKSLDDVASYAPDPARERQVLGDYGYRWGWERFWGRDGGPMTSVFVDQFQTRRGAAEYAADLAANDAELYRGTLRPQPPHMPGGCRTLTVPSPRPGDELTGPTVFAWCQHGDFSVAVTSVAASVRAASAEVRGVLLAQLSRLPGS